MENTPIVLDKYGLLWNTQPLPATQENQQANIQASLVNKIKSEIQFLFMNAAGRLAHMTP